VTQLPNTLEALEALARERLPEKSYHYYAGGAGDEATLEWNRRAFQRIGLLPRVLVDVSELDTSVELLGYRSPSPVLLAPTAFQKLSDPEGELATARAAGARGCPFVVSSLSSYTVEEVAEVATAPLWLQLYVFRDRTITEGLIRRAEAAGYTAICLTVTVPVQGNRRRDAHNRFSLPEGVDMANFRGMEQERLPDADGGSHLQSYISSQFDPTLTWSALDWIRSVTALPIVVKGVMRGDDAERAVDAGADAVVVSNHGGRQLDGAVATVDALPGVVAGAAGRTPVLLDGGVRQGADVARALCLGADAVLIGRPYLWGLAAGGEAGVGHVLDLLDEELRRAMALLGAPKIAQLTPDLLSRS